MYSIQLHVGLIHLLHGRASTCLIRLNSQLRHGWEPAAANTKPAWANASIIAAVNVSECCMPVEQHGHSHGRPQNVRRLLSLCEMPVPGLPALLYLDVLDQWDGRPPQTQRASKVCNSTTAYSKLRFRREVWVCCMLVGLGPRCCVAQTL